MILPTKRLSLNRSLLGLGSDILKIINEPKTISHLWADLKEYRESMNNARSITFDWFILALDLLYLLKIIEISNGLIRRR
jgi:hypothetical protein